MLGMPDRNPWAKNQANRMVRRFTGVIADGGSYKKLYEQYDICDFRFMYYTMHTLMSDAKKWNFPPWRAWMK